MSRSGVALAIVLSTSTAWFGCSQSPASSSERAGDFDRDWVAHPAVVESTAPHVLYAVSDIHGGFDRALTLFKAAGLASPSNTGLATWTGGDATLVVVGDSIDKGTQNLSTLRLLKSLQDQAPQSGGRVIICLGNHEAEFLADPEVKKAETLRDEIRTLGETPEEFASSHEEWGRFLRQLPVAAVVSGWFFVHSGDSRARSVASLESGFRAALSGGGWSSDEIIGDHSSLESQDWWSDASVAANLQALGARHVVMGHDPNAFDEKGAIGAQFQGRLIHIDTGMSPAVNNSTGFLLRVEQPGTAAEAVSSVDANGTVRALKMTAP